MGYVCKSHQRGRSEIKVLISQSDVSPDRALSLDGLGWIKNGRAFLRDLGEALISELAPQVYLPVGAVSTVLSPPDCGWLGLFLALVHY